jgi:hypothetical protein
MPPSFEVGAGGPEPRYLTDHRELGGHVSWIANTSILEAPPTQAASSTPPPLSRSYSDPLWADTVDTLLVNYSIMAQGPRAEYEQAFMSRWRIHPEVFAVATEDSNVAESA